MKEGIFGNIKIFLYKKWFSLMAPFLIWGGIYSELNLKNMLFVGYGTRETLLMSHSLSSLWFLPVMYLAFCYNFILDIILSKLSIRKSFKENISLGLFLLIGFSIPHLRTFGYPWGADIAFVAAAFLKIGQLLCDKFKRIKELDKGMIIMCLVCMLITFSFTFKYSMSSETIKHILMANAMYGNPIIFLFNAITGSFIVLFLSLLLDRFNFKNRYILNVGKNTLGIFLVHKPIIEVSHRFYNFLGVAPNGLFLTVLTSCIVVVISMFVICIINKCVPALLRIKKGALA